MNWFIPLGVAKNPAFIWSDESNLLTRRGRTVGQLNVKIITIEGLNVEVTRACGILFAGKPLEAESTLGAVQVPQGEFVPGSEGKLVMSWVINGCLF